MINFVLSLNRHFNFDFNGFVWYVLFCLVVLVSIGLYIWLGLVYLLSPLYLRSSRLYQCKLGID